MRHLKDILSKHRWRNVLSHHIILRAQCYTRLRQMASNDNVVRAVGAGSLAEQHEQVQNNDHERDHEHEQEHEHEQQEAVGVQKKVGLVSGVAMLVGSMIGAGIFISPAGVADGAGSVALALILWALSGIVVVFGALSYAELGLMMKQSGGDYIYILKTLGSGPAFLWVWTYAIFIKPSAVAILNITAATYILVLFYDDDCGPPPESDIQMLAVILILLLAAINVFSIRLATSIQVIFTAAKLVALLIIIIGGFVRLGQGYTSILATGFNGTNSNVGKVVNGLYGAMFSYEGWNGLNVIAEELINPERNLLLSMLIGLPMVIVVYILANVSYFTVMNIEEMMASSTVALTWARAVIPSAMWIIPVFVALSAFGGANGALYSGGRYYFATAREGHMMEVLGMLHMRRFTPIPATLLNAALGIIFVFPAGIQTLINFTQFSVWFFYGLTMVCLLVLRLRWKDTHRPFRVPLIVPIIVLVAAVILVIFPVAFYPQIEYLWATILILVGFVFYFPFVYFKLEFPCMRYITAFLQLFLEVVPTKEE